jgi:phage tail sheath protein FI
MTHTPGIYIAEQDAFPNRIVGVPTAVPAFIGYTEKATSPDGTDVTRTPVRITSLTEYEQHFGAAPPQQVSIDVEHHVDQTGATRGVHVTWTTPHGAPSCVLPYALQLFFANGGGPCLIYSLGAPTTPTLHDFTSAVTALEASPEPTLLLFPDAVDLAPADYAALVTAALASAGRTQDRFIIADVPETSSDLASLASDFRASLVTVNPSDRKYGAAYLPYLETAIPLHTTAESVTINAFTTVVLDGKGAISARSPVPEMSHRRLADIAATTPSYCANIQLAITNFLAEATVTLPPSAAIAGVYSMMDATRGVWKAPANVSLTAVRKPTIAMTTAQQGELNVDVTHGFSLNAIREFIGQGTLVWGARTLDGNSSDWRYVSVRRFVTFVEQSIKLGLQALVFERNEAATWTSVDLMISNFLTGLWRSGALAGSTARDAFSVQVGLGSTMTAQDVAEGRMRVTVLLAVVRPAEFHVITLEQMMVGGT